MHFELSVAINFLVSHLYNKLPRRRVDVFAEELEKGLRTKFSEHWYPDEPVKGSGFRSIRIIEGKIDPILKMSSQLSGLSLEEILEQLPNGLTIWIDPGEVSYRVGETGQVSFLFINRRNNEQIEKNSFSNNSSYVTSPNEVSSNADQLSQLLNSFSDRNETLNSLNFMAANQFEQELASSLERIKFESAPNLPYASLNNFMQPPQSTGNYLLGLGRSAANQNCFTAAAFAQTKFGSTKMKTHSTSHNRPNKLFNTADLQNRLSLAAQLNAVNSRSPGSFIPFPGLQYDQWNGNQASAPSSTLNSPINPSLPPQLLQNLMLSQNNSQLTNNSMNMTQNQQLFDCFASGLLPNNAKKSSFTQAQQIKNKETAVSFSPSVTRMPFESLKHPSTLCPSPKQTSERSESSLDPFSLSSSSSTFSNDASPPSNVDSIDWNNPLTPYSNIQQLLLAN